MSSSQRECLRTASWLVVLVLALGLISMASCGLKQDAGAREASPPRLVGKATISIEVVATPSATRDEPRFANPLDEPTATAKVEATSPASREEASSVESLEGQTARIEIDAASRVGLVNKLLFGGYVIAAGSGNGILDSDHHFDPEALEMIKDLKPSILRLGGQPIFEDGIGDPSARPPARCGWEDWHTHEYGVDEHMALLEAIGAEGQAMFSVAYPYALGDSTDPNSCVISSTSTSLSQMVKRASARVAYVNGDPADTMPIGVDEDGFDWQTVGHWAQQRVLNGHPEPYGVKYWDIGYESYDALDPVSAKEYGRVYTVFQSAMKRIDPGIIVAASALPEDYGDSVWNDPLLSVIGSRVDALTLHVHYPNKVYDANSMAAIVAGATQVERDLARVRRLVTTKTNRGDEIGLIVNGMRVSYDFAYEDAIPLPWNTLLVGVCEADMLGVLVENSRAYGLELAIQHWLHGAAPACAIHLDWKTGERYKRPSYYALQMWTRHFGDVLVRNGVTCHTFSVPMAYGNVGPLYRVPYLAAHTSIAGDKLYLLVINRHLADDMATTIHIDGFVPQSKATAYTLNGPRAESTDESGNHDTVVIVSSDISDASGDFTYVFPAHSVTSIELQGMPKGH